MARNLGAVVAILAFLFVSFISSAHGRDLKSSPDFYVEGVVYCDTCRVQFETSLSEPLNGALVLLECKSQGNREMVFSTTKTTNPDGTYSIKVPGEHADHMCWVILNGSPRENCSDITQAGDSVMVPSSNSIGIAGPTRYASSLGYLAKTPLPSCGKVLDAATGYMPLS